MFGDVAKRLPRKRKVTKQTKNIGMDTGLLTWV